MCQDGQSYTDRQREPPAMTTTIIGLDIAKTVFQLHAEDASGRVLYRKRLKRDGLVKFPRSIPPALIAPR